MPRRSTADLMTMTVPGVMPESPEHLSPEMREIWNEITIGLSSERVCDPGFRLLAEPLCQHIHFARFLGSVCERMLADEGALEDDAKRNAMRGLLRSHCEQTERLVSIATKLRLSPQARYYPHSKAMLKPARTGPAPWDDWRNSPDDDEEEEPNQPS